MRSSQQGWSGGHRVHPFGPTGNHPSIYLWGRLRGSPKGEGRAIYPEKKKHDLVLPERIKDHGRSGIGLLRQRVPKNIYSQEAGGGDWEPLKDGLGLSSPGKGGETLSEARE